MRLTLRTLLAYLDDILDPADKEELAQKIESSDFAEDLVHRTRDTMRRLRLSAPQPIGVGMGLDPNTVAEYLDNVLPPDQVGDYERICLESDVHLAEAAACHHVLTMVLGEPANVEPRARQRMYNIPVEARDRRRLRVEPAHTTVMTAAAPATATSTVVAAHSDGATRAGMDSRPAANELPEYLRTRPWWQSRGMVAALAAVLVVGIAAYGLSGLRGWTSEEPGEVAIHSGREAAPAAVPPVVTEPVPETEREAAVEEPVLDPVMIDPEPSAELAAEAEAAPLEAEVESGESEAGPPPLADPPQLPAPGLGAPRTASGQTPNDLNAEGAVEEAPATEMPAVEEVAAPVETPPADAAVDAAPRMNVRPQGDIVPPSEKGVEPGSEVAATAPQGVAPAMPDNRAVSDTAEDTRIAAATPAAPADATAEAGLDADVVELTPEGPPEVGTYLSGKTVLLRYDEATGSWFRVEPRSAVVVGQRLLALPEFRPKITLTSGVHLDISGGTQVQFLGATDGEAIGGDETVPAVIEVLYGRIILINTSNGENEVTLKLGSMEGTAQIARNATLAVEVERMYVPGNDPRESASPVAVRMYAPDGGVVWEDATGEVAAENASRWTLTAGEPAEVAEDPAPPEWIDQEPAVHLSEQRFGTPVIESRLVSNRPVDIQLLEIFEGSGRKEVKSLVTRSSIHVGLFAPFIQALRDPDQKWPTWRTHIETLRRAMAFSPESADGVWQALVDQRGRTAAADLYEMLCGYTVAQVGQTPEETKAGVLVRLINWLEDESLDYRVLAVYNLWEITGKQLMPNPAANLSVRKQNVRRWRDRLESGELLPVKRDGG